MMYAYIDGDDIGLKIENSFMNNDETGLATLSNSLRNIVNEITIKLINCGYEVIFGAADGIICKKKELDIEELIRLTDCMSEKLTFSIGVGTSLKDSYIALRYAKCSGKNLAVNYTKGNFFIIN